MLKRTIKLFALELIFISCAFSAISDEEDEDLYDVFGGDEDFLSIATGSKQPISKAPAVASIITADDLQQLGVMDLDDALETIPGLHVSRSPFGYAPLYLFRGIYSYYNPQVLVLINGISISNLFHGDRNLIWGGMPVKAISRIEIIRGPGSAIYGADAFAGVINIITKSTKEKKPLDLGIRVGSFDSYAAWLSIANQYKNVDLSLDIEAGTSDGQDQLVTEDSQSFLDSIFGTSASLAPGPVSLSNDNLDIRFQADYEQWTIRSGWQHRSNVGSGAGIADALDSNNRYRSDRFNLDINYRVENLFADTIGDFQLSYFSTTQEIEEDLFIFPPGTNLGAGELADGLIGNPEVFERHIRANISIKSNSWEHHSTRLDVGYYFDDLYEVRESKNFFIDPVTGAIVVSPLPLANVSDTTLVFLPEETRENFYIFAQDTWSIYQDWELTAGLRYDNYSDFGDTVNPRLALVWSTTLDLTTKLLYGEAFRAPSFAQLLAINNPVILGNPDLEPESMKSIELAFDYRIDEQYRFGVNLFHYKWEDIIQFRPDEDGVRNTAQNFGRQSGKGIEFETELQFTEQLSLVANFSYQESEDRITRSNSTNAPKRLAYLNLNWQASDHHISVSPQLHFVGDRPRGSDDAREWIDDYTLVSINVNFKPDNARWYSTIKISNLLDEDAREPTESSLPNDLPLAGRSYMIELGYEK